MRATERAESWRPPTHRSRSQKVLLVSSSLHYLRRFQNVPCTEFAGIRTIPTLKSPHGQAVTYPWVEQRNFQSHCPEDTIGGSYAYGEAVVPSADRLMAVSAMDSSGLAGHTKAAVNNHALQVIVSLEERQKIFAAIEGQPFRDFLTALQETGARPGEIRLVTAADVDLRSGVWLLKKHKTSKKTHRPRVIYLTSIMRELMTRLIIRKASCFATNTTSPGPVT